MMLLLALLLLQAADPPPGEDVVVRAPLPASPQTPATIVVEPAAMLIATCDADGDGLVDRIELNEGLEKTFKASDTAKTGAMRYLAYSDWALRWLGDRAALPSPYEVDRNNDDQITLAELQDHFSRLFARYDTNSDKTISRAELLTYRAAPIGSSGPPGSLSRTPKGKPSQPKDQDRRH